MAAVNTHLPHFLMIGCYRTAFFYFAEVSAYYFKCLRLLFTFRNLYSYTKETQIITFLFIIYFKF